MANELAIVDKKKLSPQERQDIDKQVEDLIERHKQNRYEINRLVFESTAALTAGDKSAQDMNTQGMLKRFRKRFTGGNARTQDVINADLVKAQYAAQQTLQKLADQNQLNVELIDLFNERLNASLTEVNAELNDIYKTLLEFFSEAKKQLIDHEKRIKQLEHRDKLQHWTINIRNRTFNGIEYKDLDDATKIVCLVRDFLELIGGEILSDDCLYLKTALESVGLKLKAEMSDERFIREVGRSTKLYNHLFGEKERLADFATEYEPLILELREINQNASRKFFVAQESESPVQIIEEKMREPLAVDTYELALELLCNLKNTKLAREFYLKRKRAKELFLNCQITEALPLLEELATAGDVRARYILALIYNEGINVESNADYARDLLASNAAEGDACSVIYGTIRTDLLTSNNIKGLKVTCKKIEDSSDVFERYELTAIQDAEKALIELKRIAEDGCFLACHELGCRYYFGRGVTKDKETARKYFEQSAAKGYAKSMLYLGNLSVNKEQVIKWYVRAYEKGISSDDLIFCIGRCYKDLEQYPDALRWWQIGANKNYSRCLGALADVYRLGIYGISKDWSKAAYYLECLINTENANNTSLLSCNNLGLNEYRLGEIYDKGGFNVEADKQRAVEFYIQAYERSSSSIYIPVIANTYYTQKRYKEAVKWWKIGADKNDIQCLVNLATSYYHGHGVSKNYSQVANYLMHAIGDDRHIPECVSKNFLLLGDIYWEGDNYLSVDKEQAIKWYKKAYQYDFTSDKSINRIVLFYANFSERLKWLEIGAEKNYTSCLVHLAKLYRHGWYTTTGSVAKNYSKAVEYCNRAVKSAEANGCSKSEIVKVCDKIKERGLLESIFS